MPMSGGQLYRMMETKESSKGSYYNHPYPTLYYYLTYDTAVSSLLGQEIAKKYA